MIPSFNAAPSHPTSSPLTRTGGAIIVGNLGVNKWCAGSDTGTCSDSRRGLAATRSSRLATASGGVGIWLTEWDLSIAIVKWASRSRVEAFGNDTRAWDSVGEQSEKQQKESNKKRGMSRGKTSIHKADIKYTHLDRTKCSFRAKINRPSQHSIWACAIPGFPTCPTT